MALKFTNDELLALLDNRAAFGDAISRRAAERLREALAIARVPARLWDNKAASRKDALLNRKD